MIFLKFLGTWVKITALTVLALILERIFLTNFWLFALVAGLTILGYIGLTAALWREWRSSDSYSYQVVRVDQD